MFCKCFILHVTTFLRTETEVRTSVTSINIQQSGYQIQEAAAGHLGKFRMTISLEWVIRSTFMN